MVNMGRKLRRDLAVVDNGLQSENIDLYLLVGR